MKKDKDKSLLDDRRFSIPLSILLAVAMWMVVTMVINPNSTFTIYNVPVDFNYNSTSYTSKGLDIVNNPQKNVSLKLEGNGYDLSGLKAEDFVVYPDYSSVNGPGEVTLPLRVLVRDSASQVKATVNKDERVTVVFDSVEEKTFTVQVQASDLTIADGYILQGTVASPSSVTVSGPASEVDSIDRIVARVESSSDLENMSESKIKTVALDLDQREALNQALVDNFQVDADTITAENISSTVSSEMRQDAVVAVLTAAVFMLLYIWLRFKDIRFATSAVLALLHDVVVVILFYAVSRIAIGNTFIACILTIVGYSINATIVIFDRIREELRYQTRSTDLKLLVNKSVTETLTRSIYTNLTTFIMVAVLYILGVSSIREFALPLIVGIVWGAYSSVCITAALWYVMKTKIGGKKTAGKGKK